MREQSRAKMFATTGVDAEPNSAHTYSSCRRRQIKVGFLHPLFGTRELGSAVLYIRLCILPLKII